MIIITGHSMIRYRSLLTTANSCMAKLNNESKQIMYAHAPMHTQAYTQVYRHANRPLISHSGVEESTM